MTVEKPVEFFKELGVKLTSEEIMVYGREIGRKIAARKELDDKRKLVAGEFRSDLAKFDADIKRMSEVLSKGEEPRQVKCERMFEGGVMRTRRTDTGDVIDVRPPTDSEMQREFPFGGAGKVDTGASPDPEAFDGKGDFEDEGEEEGDDGEGDSEGHVRGEDGKVVGEFSSSSTGGVGFHAAGDERADEEPGETHVERDDQEPPLTATIADQAKSKRVQRTSAGKPIKTAYKKSAKKGKR